MRSHTVSGAALWPAITLIGIVAAGAPTLAKTIAVQSPDGRNRMTVSDDGGCLTYSFDRNGDPVIVDARLGFRLEYGTVLGQDVRISQISRDQRDTTWQPVYGERSQIRNHYREVTIRCEPHTPESPAPTFDLVCRAYDEGIAFAYRFSADEEADSAALTVIDDLTEFAFTGAHRCWPVYSAQGEYQSATLDEVQPNCERPLLVEIADGPAVAVGEARLVDFARMRLQPSDRPHAVRAHLAGNAVIEPPYITPWRVVMTADDPCQLIERNYLLLNLNDPCALDDTSWIKPGKVIREVTLTTAGGKACVDFAVKMGISYVEYDAGWYGHEYDDASDATTVTPDPKRVGDVHALDLHEVINYARQHGVGIIVYVNRRALERQLDEILPLYRRWGIAGVKYGFVQVGSQQWTTWLHEAVRKAAENRLMVDIHDEYRPTGYERTYPNLMTQEGIRGNEEMPPAEHNTILPFTRGLCGAGDYTICWYTPRIKTTHAHQLACAVVFYSPWQFVFWYDRPQQYRREPATQFLKDVPTVWDETRVLAGEVNEYIITARRSGDAWFVGALNSQRRRELPVSLDFLEEHRSYRATVYSDASAEGNRPFEVAVLGLRVTQRDRLQVDMASNGGCAIHLVPVEESNR